MENSDFNRNLSKAKLFAATLLTVVAASLFKNVHAESDSTTVLNKSDSTILLKKLRSRFITNLHHVQTDYYYFKQAFSGVDDEFINRFAPKRKINKDISENYSDSIWHGEMKENFYHYYSDYLNTLELQDSCKLEISKEAGKFMLEHNVAIKPLYNFNHDATKLNQFMIYNPVESEGGRPAERFGNKVLLVPDQSNIALICAGTSSVKVTVEEDDLLFTIVNSENGQTSTITLPQGNMKDLIETLSKTSGL